MGKKDKTAADGKGAAGAPPAEEKREPMKPGDYTVQVHLIEARNLKGRGIGDMSDPVAVIEVLGKKQNSKVYKSSLNVVFNEIFVFEFQKLELAEVESGQISISVFDANTFRRDVMIGMYSFDMQSIYYNKHHELFRQWVALTDITDAAEGIQGYLKLSITVLGPGDEQHTHSASEEDDEDSGMMSVIMPPHLDQKGFMLKVRVHEVSELPNMDESFFGAGGCDPMARVVFAGVDLKGKHKKGMSCPMNDEFQIPVMEPVMSSKISLSIFDWDQAGSDDRIKTITLNYLEIKKNTDYWNTPRWVNFYGAPLSVSDKEGSIAHKMNMDFLQGSHYRGRALISAEVYESTDPKKDVSVCMAIQNKPRTERWVMHCDLMEGSEIPDKGEMHIEVSCGNFHVSSAGVRPVEGRAKWYQEIRLPEGEWPVFDYPSEPSEVPNIFIYLCDKKGQHISFFSRPFREVLAKGWNAPPEWVVLKEDAALAEASLVKILDPDNYEFPGSVLISIKVGRLSEAPARDPRAAEPEAVGGPASSTSAGPPASVPSSAANTPRTVASAAGPGASSSTALTVPDPRIAPELLDQKSSHGSFSISKGPTYGTLTLTIVEGSELPANTSGKTAAYIKVKVGDRKFATQAIKDNDSPEWNETFVFENVLITAPVELKLKNKELISDTTLGLAEVDLRTVARENRSGPGHDFDAEKWVLISDRSANARVKIRFKFKYLSMAESQAAEEAAKRKRKATRAGAGARFVEPEQSQYQLRVHLYQARGLPATDSNGLADPYVVVRLAGKSLKSDKRLETVNPQWYKSYALNVGLPDPLWLSPRIQLYVYDWDATSGDDAMCHFSLTVEEAMKLNPSNTELVPTWFQMVDWNDQPIEGCKLLASFQLLTIQDATAPMPDISPPTVPKILEITTLGCRSLRSLLGIHKTYIEYELPNGKRFATEKSVKPSAESPNFLQNVKIPLDLPVASIYAPFVDIEVKDIMFGGFVKRLIGTASLGLGQFLPNPNAKEIMRIPGPSDVVKKPRGMTYTGWDSDDDDTASTASGRSKGRKHKKKHRDKERSHTVIDIEPEHDAGLESWTTPLLPAPDSSLPLEQKVALMRGLKQKNYGSIDENGAEIKLDIKEEKEMTTLPGGKKSESAPPPTASDFASTQPEGVETSADALTLPAVNLDDDEEPPEYMKGRATIDNELEDEIKLHPFHEIGLFTGQKNGLLGDTYQQIGLWKGLIRLLSPEEQDSPENKAIEQKITEMLKPQQLMLRLYIMKGIKLNPRDPDGSSDPYLRIKVGKLEVNTRSRYLPKTLDPGFYESIEIPVTLPGDALVSIEVMDWDGIADDLIGKTVIDIEDRWFAQQWRSLALKPVEIRTLKSPTSSAPQGKLSLWAELLTLNDAKKIQMWNIKPPPPEPYELRVIVWGCRDVTIKDLTTGQNDLYITCQPSVPGLKGQETDTHFRSKKGKGNFNWRMKWILNLPMKPWPRLRFQIWDRDILAANDFICESAIGLKGLCKEALKKKDRVKIMVKNKDRFWIEHMTNPNEGDKDQGRMELTIELMPKSVADQLPAGYGRSDPNQNPVLPEPEGRLQWSLLTNPFALLRELLGDRLCFKLCCAVCIVFFGFTCVMMAPSIFSNLMVQLMLPRRWTFGGSD